VTWSRAEASPFLGIRKQYANDCQLTHWSLGNSA